MNPYRLDMDSPPYQTAASIPNLAAMRGTEEAEKIQVQLLPQVTCHFLILIQYVMTSYIIVFLATNK